MSFPEVLFPSNSALTLLELNNTLTVATPSILLTADSIFLMQDGQVTGPNWITAWLMIHSSYLSDMTIV